ncbi:MAG TPA: hypothetical protein VFU05_08520 [Cyclobacteriaceae bacterium]|nr:hypothetical protein [Cyclobacteriaceae bacterium]
MKTKFTLGLLVILTMIVSFGLIKKGTKDEITIVAFYMQYACGDDNIDMKVKSVDNSDFKFLIDKDIAPTTNFLTQGALIDFVNDKTLMWQKGQAGEYLESFTLVGHIKDSKDDTDCAIATEFVVDKIKYGIEKEFREF